MHTLGTYLRNLVKAPLFLVLRFVHDALRSHARSIFHLSFDAEHPLAGFWELESIAGVQGPSSKFTWKVGLLLCVRLCLAVSQICAYFFPFGDVQTSGLCLRHCAFAGFANFEVGMLYADEDPQVWRTMVSTDFCRCLHRDHVPGGGMGGEGPPPAPWVRGTWGASRGGCCREILVGTVVQVAIGGKQHLCPFPWLSQDVCLAFFGHPMSHFSPRSLATRAWACQLCCHNSRPNFSHCFGGAAHRRAELVRDVCTVFGFEQLGPRTARFGPLLRRRRPGQADSAGGNGERQRSALQPKPRGRSTSTSELAVRIKCIKAQIRILVKMSSQYKHRGRGFRAMQEAKQKRQKQCGGTSFFSQEEEVSVGVSSQAAVGSFSWSGTLDVSARVFVLVTPQNFGKLGSWLCLKGFGLLQCPFFAASHQLVPFSRSRFSLPVLFGLWTYSWVALRPWLSAVAPR